MNPSASSLATARRCYVGSYTRLGGAGISEVRWGGSEPTSPRLVAATPNPSFLALHPTGHTLYAVNEQPDGAVSAFARDPVTGDLTLLGSGTTGGAAPCHLAVHPSGHWLAVANYRGAQVVLFDLQPDGRLGDPLAMRQHHGRGPHPTRQLQAHPHGVYWTAQGRELWVPDLGVDRIVRYRFDPAAESCLADLPAISLPAGCGPRHLAFHPTANVAYCLNELDSTLVPLAQDLVCGEWTAGPAQSTLPFGNTTVSTAAEIVMHPEGRWLFCSNRGHDSIAVFAVGTNPAAPFITGIHPTGGKNPRHLALSPDARYLLMANQDTHTLTLAPFDSASGHLGTANPLATLTAPACALCLE